MKIINRFKALSFFLVIAYLLAACGGTLPHSTTSAKGSKVEANVVAFTGIVEAMNGTQWTVRGQTLTLDPQVSLDPNIAVGDSVKVEANVSTDGAVVALKVESSTNDDAVMFQVLKRAVMKVGVIAATMVSMIQVAGVLTDLVGAGQAAKTLSENDLRSAALRKFFNSSL